MTDPEQRARDVHWGGMVVVVYADGAASEGVVIWDGEAAALGLPHLTRWPPQRKGKYRSTVADR